MEAKSDKKEIEENVFFSFFLKNYKQTYDVVHNLVFFIAANIFISIYVQAENSKTPISI